MDSTILAVAITALPSTIAAVSGIVAAINNKKADIEKIDKKIDTVSKQVKECSNDIAITKEASFYALQAHVENGVNGDVKKAHTRIKDNVFKGENK